MHDAVIRPHGGDFRVVMLIYCSIKSCFDVAITTLCWWVLLLAYTVEGSPYYHLVNFLGLAANRLALMILGSTFSWIDMCCYTAGIGLVYLMEINRQKQNTTRVP
jgi:hypothetical protein